MIKKIFIAIMAAVVLIHGVTFAKKKTAEILRDKLIFQLTAKDIFNILNPTSENFLAEIKTLENGGSSDVGDLIMFPTKNLGIDTEKYKNLGAEYVIQCEILGIGLAQEQERDFGFGNGVGIGIGTDGGFGIGIYNGGSSLRNSYCTAVNMQIIEVESGAVVARKNFIGQALKHRKPKKGYNDASDEAYLKSLNDAAKTIVKRVVNFAAKNFEQYSKVAK